MKIVYRKTEKQFNGRGWEPIARMSSFRDAEIAQMFEDADLYQIDWSSLGRPYNDAQRIPQLLRELRDHASDGGSDYEDTFGEFYNEINHQGTLYEVTAAAIPFLIDIIRSGSSSGHSDIAVDLLVWFGDLGQDTLYKENNAPQAVAGINPFTRQACTYYAIDDRPAAKKTRDALRTGFDLYIDLLRRSRGLVRGAAAYALAHYPERSKEFGPPIRDAGEAEPNPYLRAGLILSLGYLRDGSADSRMFLLQAVQSGRDDTERIAGAVALAHVFAQQTPKMAIDLLHDVQASAEYRDGFAVRRTSRNRPSQDGLLWGTSRLFEKAYQLVGLESNGDRDVDQ